MLRVRGVSRISVQVHDVVQIAGPRAFAERTQLFSEDLFRAFDWPTKLRSART
jgi:hypothetical protein